jgi:hypothetical protein
MLSDLLTQKSGKKNRNIDLIDRIDRIAFRESSRVVQFAT